MVGRIVAFRAHVRRARGRFKLGQDETSQTRKELFEKLDDADLVSWMKLFNPEPVKQQPQ
jgi:predicted FMN-binding regulatory protein PaiB